MPRRDHYKTYLRQRKTIIKVCGINSDNLYFLKKEDIMRKQK
jgi:hypothetical protein